jgi:hypothetical protein
VHGDNSSGRQISFPSFKNNCPETASKRHIDIGGDLDEIRFPRNASAEIRSLLRQDIDGPNIFATEEIMEAMTVRTKRDPAKMSEINIQKSWQEFLMYYKPDM